MEPILKAWKRDLWKGIEERTHFKNLEDLQRFPTEELFVKLDKSDYTKKAVATLKRNIGNEKNVSRTAHSIVRDYLLTNLLLNNASRPGALANMTLGEFYKDDEQADGFVVSVKEHKTKYKGPANVAFTKNLYNQTKNYVRFMRNATDQLKSTTEGHVFVTWKGMKMASSLVSTQFDQFWKRSVCDILYSGRVNPTLFRKQLTTTVHENHKEKAQVTANHLSHSLATAEKNYNVVNKQKCAAAVSKSIANIQRGIASGILYSEIVPLFAAYIEEGTVNKFIVDKVLSGPKYEEVGERERKKILDRLRYQIKAKCVSHKDDLEKEFTGDDPTYQESSEEIPEEEEPFIKERRKRVSEEPCNSHTLFPEKRMRRNFTDEENALFRRHLGKKYVRSKCKIIKADFEEDIRSIPELAQLIEKFGISGLIVKVRSERKKL